MKSFAKRFGLVLLITCLLTGAALGAEILTFEFSALAGSEATANSNSNDANLTSSTISRGSGLTASANGGRFNATSWALTSIANAVSGNDYMEFSITPQSGYQFSVSSIYLQMQRSSTGPSEIALRSSADNYTTNLDQIYTITDATSTQNFTFTFSQSNSESAITYRIYMWAESTSGSGGIGDGSGNDLIINGTTSMIPAAVNLPTDFTAVTASTSQINLTWTDNAAGDEVMVVYDEDNSFTVPVDGVTYSGTALGGTVIYQGTAEAYNHTSLSSGTQYFYKAWSVDVGDNYSAGVITNGTTFKDEPSNHPTSLSVNTIGYTTMDLDWTDAIGSVLPDGYLIKGSSVGFGDISAPSDGTAESDGALIKNIEHGVQAVEFTGLTNNTTYYFKIWSYTNTGTNVDYKLDGTVPEISGTTLNIPSLPFVENFDYTAGDYLTAHGWTAHSASGTTPIQVVTPGLEFSGYAGSGIGNAADVGNTGEDVHHIFEEVTSGSVYASFIIKTGASNAAGYFLNLGQQTIGSTYFSRVWVNATGDGVGIGASAPDPYVAITQGVPILLVVKYTIATGVSDLYVCSSVPATEPVSPDASYTDAIFNVGSIALRQFSSSQDIIVDGIRISTSWNEAPLPITLTSFTAKAVGGVVELAWETATETNNANFVIYRNDEAIASVAGTGTTTEPHNYSYVDDAVVPGVTYTYVLADVDYSNTETKYLDEAVTVTVGNDIMEADFVVGAAYPNPFNPTAVVPLELSRDAMVKASLYDLNGREVKALVNATFTAGTHDLRIDGAGLTTGLYLVQVVVDNVIDVQKIALMK